MQIGIAMFSNARLTAGGRERVSSTKIIYDRPSFPRIEELRGFR